MAFTYDLASTDSAIVIISKLRLKTGDTIETRGPRPGVAGNSNFADEEITVFYESEGSHQERAAAAIFEALAAEWGARAGFRRTGPESEDSRQAEFYTAEAEKLRSRYGYATNDEADERKGGFSIQALRRGQS